MESTQNADAKVLDAPGAAGAEVAQAAAPADAAGEVPKTGVL